VLTKAAFDHKYNKNSNIVQYYFNLKKLYFHNILYVIYPYDGKAVFFFSIITPVLCHMILQKSF